jgi:voltage-gated sodium channel
MSTTDIKIDMPSEKSVAATKSRVSKYVGIPTKQDSLMGITRQRSWANKHSPLLVRIVEHTYFECVIGLLIALNCITVGVEVQYCPAVDSLRWMPPDNSPLASISLSDRLTKVQSGEWNKYEPSRHCPADFLRISEYVFTALFVIEFFLRVMVFGKYYYCSMSKFLDACLVWLTGFLVVFILEPLNLRPDRVRVFTMLRAFRLIRVARMVQGNPMLKDAWLLCKGLAESVKTLFWTIVVIFFVNFAFAVVAVIFIGDDSVYTCASASEESNGQHQECAHLTDDMQVHGYFNGLGNTMFTLLQIATGDSWASGVARPAMKFQPAVWIFFIVYVAVAMLVLLNLVTAVIVENALAISKQDEKQKLFQLEQRKKAQITSLKKIFAALDVDGSGAIDEAEFIEACTNRQDIMNKFRLLDFDDHEILNLFKDLEVSSDGLLSLQEFESGLHSMQGEAKNKDLVRIQKAIERLNQRVEVLNDGSIPTAISKHNSRERSVSPQRRSSSKPSLSPSSANFAQVSSMGSSRRNATMGSSLGSSVASSLPATMGLNVTEPAPLAVDLQRLDPSVRDLADVLVNHLGGLEQRMEQKFARLEHRQATALESIVAHLNTNNVKPAIALDKAASITKARAYDVIAVANEDFRKSTLAEATDKYIDRHPRGI